MGERIQIPDLRTLKRQIRRDPQLQELSDCFTDVPKAVSRVWKKDYQPWFTDHGPAHSMRVATNALRLAEIPMLHPARRLSTLEAFMLWAAAWLHDIGMQDLLAAGPLGTIDAEGYAHVRREHPDRTSENILRNWGALGLPENDPVLAETIANITRAHGTGFYRLTIDERLQITGTVRNQEVRPQLLAALLLFADELDLHYERVQPLPGWSTLNGVSAAHAFKHSSVRAVKSVCNSHGDISVELQLAFPQDLSAEDRLAIQRWIEVKLRRQMGLIEPEILAGFGLQARFDRAIRTTILPLRAHIAPPSHEALRHVRADTARDELVDHKLAFDQIWREIRDDGIILILPRQPANDPWADDGRHDLMAAISSHAAAHGRVVCVNRRPSLALGVTAADIVAEWLLELGESAPEPTGHETTMRSACLEKLLTALHASETLSFLFSIDRAELIDPDGLTWLAVDAAPRMRATASVAFLMTGGVATVFPVPGASVISLTMPDTDAADVTAYLERFTSRDVATAESDSIQTYEQVKRQASSHEAQLQARRLVYAAH